jgi:Dpy-30 motif
MPSPPTRRDKTKNATHPLSFPSPPQAPLNVRAYLEKEVVPALMPVLTEMARVRPPAPLEWLADKLKEMAQTGQAPPEGG